MQQQELPAPPPAAAAAAAEAADAAAEAAVAAAAEACSSSKLKKQQAAESTNKQKCGLYCALLGTRWKQHPHFFVVLFVRDHAVQQQMKGKNQTKLMLQTLAGRTDLAFCSIRISETSGNQRSLSSTATTKARFRRDE